MILQQIKAKIPDRQNVSLKITESETKNKAVVWLTSMSNDSSKKLLLSNLSNQFYSFVDFLFWKEKVLMFDAMKIVKLMLSTIKAGNILALSLVEAMNMVEIRLE